MLAGMNYKGKKLGGTLLHRRDHRRYLDEVWSGADNVNDFQHIQLVLVLGFGFWSLKKPSKGLKTKNPRPVPTA